MMEKIQITDSSVAVALNKSLPLVSKSTNGLMPSLFYRMSTKHFSAVSEMGCKVIATCRVNTVGVLLLTAGVQASYVLTGIVGVSCDANTVKFFKNDLIGILPNFYYKRLDDSSIILAVHDRAPWSHYDVVSFSERISIEIRKIDSLDGFTQVTFN